MKTLDKKLLEGLEYYPEKKIPIEMKVEAHYPGTFVLTVTDSEWISLKEESYK